MRGIVFLGEHEVELRDFPDPQPGPREVVVAIKASGMCGSDLPPYRAPRDAFRNIIRGHEPCGDIASHGTAVSDDEAPIGRRVMVHHYSGCGECKYCRVGYSQLCLTGHLVYGANAHGGHADYILVRPHMLVALPDDLSHEEGAAISCGTGTAYDALRRLSVSGRDTLAVFGQGPVGLSATMLAKAMGARVIAFDPSAERLALATSFGADFVFDPRAQDPVQSVRDLTHGEGATTALDCTGNPEARVNAVKCAAVWGRVCFVGEGNTATFDVSPDIIHKQLTIYGSWTFSSVGQAECTQFIADHKLPLQRLLTHRFSLNQAVDAYKLFNTQTTGKGVFINP